MTTPVTLITGASTGLGQATALHLARQGHHVWATMRTPETGSAVLREAAAREGLRISIEALDVRDPASIARAVGVVLATSGRIDVLINNAGLCDLGAVERVSEAQTLAMFDTNVFGSLRMCRAVLPAMRAQGVGTIVNLSSVAARMVAGGNGLYSATKQALEAISEALAIEVMPYGVRVAIIEPGFFATPILDKAPGAIAFAADAPYSDVERRIVGIFQAGKTSVAGDPKVVAEAIEHAITTTAPRLRYLVGIDAPVLTRGRQEMSDESYVQTFGRPQTDGEWFTAFMTRFPLQGAQA